MRALLLAACAVGCLPGTARADTYSVAISNVHHADMGIDYQLAYADFDSSRGTLTSASLQASGYYTASVTDAAPFTRSNVDFGPSTLSLLGAIIANFGTHTASFSGDTAAVTFAVSFADTLPAGLVTGSNTADTFEITGGQGWSNYPGGLTDPEDTSTLSLASAAIVYTYTPFATAVPEPLSLALLAGGVACVAGTRRRHGVTTT